MPTTLSHEEYRKAFGVPPHQPKASETQKYALENALDIRKFEIQLYWTRATYFWTFIAAALAAYGAIQTINDSNEKISLSVFLSCLGLVLSFAWYCANRGSKQWQENWENHVDLLENDVIGPLYKTVIRRPSPRGFWAVFRNILTGPRPFSVSKINQIISIYITLIWVLLLGHSLPPISFKHRFSWEYTLSVGLTIVTLWGIWKLGTTDLDDFTNIADQRSAGLDDPLKSVGSP
jgi:hypothetical protein